MSAPSVEPPKRLPARLAWLNGPPGTGKRTLAWYLRDVWHVGVFDADEVGLVLQEGLPRGVCPADVQDMPAWLGTVVRLGTELGRAWPPFAVMRATVYEPDTVVGLLDELRRELEVVHVVLTGDEDYLRTRIHERLVDREAKRRALDNLRPALAGLAKVPDSVHLDTTHRGTDKVAADLADALQAQGWLGQANHWMPGVPG